MAMLYTSLKPILFHDELQRRHQNSNIQLSHSVESIVKDVKEKTKLNEPFCVFLYGEPGCGRTTLMLQIHDALLGNTLVDCEILGVRVQAGCSVESLWDFLSEICKKKQDKDTASLLTQSTAKLSKKYKAGQAFISSNFKLVCVDDACSDGGVIWSHFSHLLRETKICVIVVCSRKDSHLLQVTLREQTVLPVEIKGFSVDSFKKSLDHELPNWSLSKEQQLKICSLLNGNPTALKIFVNVVHEFKLPPESLNNSCLSCVLACVQDEQNEQESNSVLRALQFSFENLTACEKQVFGQLCQLREAVPLANVSEEVEKLVRLGLVEKEVVSVDSRVHDVIYCVSVASCVQLSSLQLTCTSVDSSQHCCEVKVHFSAFHEWYALLSEKLCKLISDAEGNAWPFVPEKWQYISNAGAEERYNIRELITAKNSVVPYLTEQQILEECLFQAVKGKMYSIVAALVLVMDRFTYWQGSSHATLQLVEYLKANSPSTPIAPQLLIRKVRVMKNTGDLQGAEQALDELLVKKSHVGEWVYKEKHDHQLVSAVCIQIKGDIQYNLGQWLQGAKLLLESLILFSTLPIPDTKGISSSLAILANCLEQMSVSEYVPLAQMYGLTASHPLLQAYYCSYESAMRSQYTPLFYARHKCHAAEFMLHYSRLISNEAQRKEHLRIAIEDFKDSIQAHKEVKSLTSREQFFVFVCAVYKLSIAYQEMAEQGCIQQGEYIGKISMLLYEHYCSFTGVILLDEEITKLITHCLNILQLNQFCDEGPSNTEGLTEVVDDRRPSNALGVVSSGTDKDLPHTERLAVLHDGSSLVMEKLDVKTTCSSWEMSIADRPVNGVQASVDDVNEEFAFANHEVVLRVRSEGQSVTDKLKETRECMTSDSTEVLSALITSSSLSVSSDESQREKNRSDSGLTVDRYCGTAVTMETVDRSVVTQNLEQETVPLLCDRFLPPKAATIQPQLHSFNLDSSQRVQGAIVWRFDSSRNEWRGDKTLAYVGDLLELEKGKEGAQRNAFMVEFINQDDPFAKYVAKCYKRSKNVKQYQQDVICQMTARYYATLFNQQLYHAGLNVDHIQFLPVVLLQLVNEDGSLSGVYNVERYMAGEFVKLTNNLNFVRKEGRVSDLVLAFSHFTYQASNGQLIIVDIQGWTPASGQTGCTFLTDPQIHSVVYKCFGTGNLRQEGINSFWKEMHPRCNDLCSKLQLIRPDVKTSE